MHFLKVSLISIAMKPELFTENLMIPSRKSSFLVMQVYLEQRLMDVTR